MGARVLVAVAGIGAIHLTAPASAVASGVCPASGTLADIIAVDATDPGPLTGQFRPIYGVFAESAANCWSGDEIVLTGFISRPEGLGGVEFFTIEPAWLVSRAHSLSTSDAVDPDVGPVGPFFPVAVPPQLEEAFTSLGGHWVRVSGHFNDRIAKTCVVTSANMDPERVPTPEEGVQICRTSFVVTSVEPMAALNTDTVTFEEPADGSPGWPALLAATATAAAFVLFLRHSSERR
jgi:hypothetical protein